ncbi:unnamed protein product [Phytomonas sp. EM1]|nr:unnamed protein product [Phytomonas sp. EM1]|eukprot:CCW65550.1 unnamed protein product [Phytomonas sp. isolate EM1]
MTDLKKNRENTEYALKIGSQTGSSGDSGCLNKKITLPRTLPRQASNPRVGLKSSAAGHNHTPYTYRPVKVVGSGSFGVVVHAKIEETGEDVAIKQVRYDSRLHNRELMIMRDLIQSGCDGNSSSGGGTSNPTPVAGNTEGFGSSRPGAPQGDPAHRGESGKPIFPEGGGVKPKVSNAPTTSSPLSTELLSSTSSPSSLASPAAPGSPTGFLLRRHPNIVQLRTYYYSTDPETNEQYVNLVMNYLPTDFFAMKQKYFKRIREGATAKKGGAPRDARRRKSSNANPTALDRSEGDSNSLHHNSGSMLFPLLWTKLILFQLGRALAFLHGKDICHRDIKPANMLIDTETGRLQLCDFGSAKRICRKGVDKNVSYICSRYYRAPELLFGVMHYGCEVDMWSVGCIAAELLREGGHPVFKGITTVDQMAEIFKVLGAPSMSEMYAMNSQSAAAMLQTHRQYGGRGFPSPSIPGSSTAAAASAVGAPTGLPPPPSSTQGISDADGNDGVDGDSFHPAYGLASDYFEHYNVLKVKALAWTHVLHCDAPSTAVKLVSELLRYVPGERLTAVEFVEHAFFDDLFSQPHDDAARETEESPREGHGKNLPWRLPRLENGKTLPIEMFMLTETETHLYSEKFQSKMNREVQRIYAAMQVAGAASTGASR